LLTVVVLRAMATRPLRRPAPAELACLFGFGLLVCSLAQTPTPWGQARRLADTGPHVFARPPGQAFVAAHTRPGEPVVLFTGLGHRIAYNAGIDDVERYTGSRSVQTEEQLAESAEALRAAGGRKLFVWTRDTFPSAITAIERGFERRARGPAGVELWVAR
jgi:hypothetical protein